MPSTPRISDPASQPSDIAIVGAGPAGLSMALGLASLNKRVCLFDKTPLDDLASPQFDGREIALSMRSVRIMEKLGVWERIPEEERSPLRDARVMTGRFDRSLHFDPAASGADKLGFLVPNHLIRQVLYDRLRETGAGEIIAGRDVAGIKVEPGCSHVRFGNGQSHETSMLIAADTRFSAIRRQAGISASMHDFGRTMIVSRVQLVLPHDHTAWECLLPDGAIALLPLTANRASLVLTLPPEDAEHALSLDISAYVEDANRRLGHRFGTLTPLSDRISYPLVGVFANRFAKPGFALVGDAAVGMHPVTAHGFNLGIQGTDRLAEELMTAQRRGRSWPDWQALAAYDRKHRSRARPLYEGTKIIAELSGQDSIVARLARTALIDAGRVLSPARQLVLQQLA